MKIIVDKLPKTNDDCLFCIQDRGGFHKCIFELKSYDFHGLTTEYYNCKLTKHEACPYLEEVENG